MCSSDLSRSDTVGEQSSRRALERISRNGRRSTSRLGRAGEAGRLEVRGWQLELLSAPLVPEAAGFDTPGLAGGVLAPGGLCRRILTTASFLPGPNRGTHCPVRRQPRPFGRGLRLPLSGPSLH